MTNLSLGVTQIMLIIQGVTQIIKLTSKKKFLYIFIVTLTLILNLFILFKHKI